MAEKNSLKMHFFEVIRRNCPLVL